MLMDFSTTYVANSQPFGSGRAAIVMQFVTESKRVAFERIVRKNLQKGLQYLRGHFKSDLELKEYCDSISVRERFPRSWSEQIQVTKKCLEDCLDNKKDRMVSFRMRNNRSKPALMIVTKITKK